MTQMAAARRISKVLAGRCAYHGKDILRFHTIYWPIMLMALDSAAAQAGIRTPVAAGGRWQDVQVKGNAIYADERVHYFGVDAVRYFVLHEMPFAQDGTITWDLMVERVNSDLANILGNLVSRTISMSNKYFGGRIDNAHVSEPVDDELITLHWKRRKKWKRRWTSCG